MARDEYRAAPAELRRLLSAGEGYASIARRYDVGPNTVRYRVRKLQLPVRANGRAPNEAALRMALSHSDISLKEIARNFKCSAQTIAAAARSYGLPTDRRGRESLGASR